MKFYKQRMSGNKDLERTRAERELKQNIELLNETTQKTLSRSEKITVPSNLKQMEIDS